MNGWSWIRIAAVCGLLAVAAGAFGTHGLRARISKEMLEIYRTAAEYHMYHALALAATGLVMAYGRGPTPALQVAAWCFLVGIILFSGSLYGLAISGHRWLGAITPIGGTAWLVGWLALAIGAGSGRA